MIPKSGNRFSDKIMLKRKRLEIGGGLPTWRLPAAASGLYVIPPMTRGIPPKQFL